MTAIQPTTLEGDRVRLEPLRLEHTDALCRIGLDADLWRWTVSRISTKEEMRAYVETALREQAEGKSLPFVTIEKASGAIVGSTRFGNIDSGNARVEIGWTWVARDWQRSFVNTEAKLLMLRFAFETLRCNRVELKTDKLNARSSHAILRIGATEEGTLRSHISVVGGRVRDTVYFSIIADEWAMVRAKLEARLIQA